MIKKVLRQLYYQLPAKLPCTGFAFPCRNVVFELTYSCNLDCQMCSYKNEIKTAPSSKKRNPLSKDEIIDLLNQLPHNSNITFTGGEIFLKKDILAILEHAAKLHKVSLATNGMLFTPEIANQLICWRTQSIGLSLDGEKNIHNKIRRNPQAYDKLINAIQILNEHKNTQNSFLPHVNLNGVILEENFQSLYRNLDIAKKFNLSCTFQVLDASLNRSGWRLSDTINSSDKIIEQVETIDQESLKKELFNLIKSAKTKNVKISFLPELSIDEIVQYYGKNFQTKNWHCFQPWSTMRISPYGDVFPCLNFKIGNVQDKKLSDLWSSDNYKTFRKLLAQKSLFDSCVGCCKMVRKT